jgi:PRC-barrel domain
MSAPTSATSDAIVVENLTDWLGQDIVDLHGDKLGKLENVYYDGQVDLPAFASFKSGVLSKKLTLVPLAGASVGRDWVRVRWDKDQVKDAPGFDPDAELTLEDEQAAYRAFGLEYRPPGPGVRRLAKR